MIKLDCHGNPHRLSPQLQAELGGRLGALALNRYPGERVNECAAPWPPMRGCLEGSTSCWATGSDELNFVDRHGLRRCPVPPSWRRCPAS